MPDIAPITPDSLMLVDGLNIIRRVYGAQDGPDTEEKVEAALKSSFGSFKRALREVQPTHALVACDYGGHTWRHDLYPDYRKSREPMPQILRDALPAFHARIRDELSLTTRCIPFVEADDVIATVAFKWLALKRGPISVLSRDKDMAWLMAFGARIRDHFASEWRDEAWCFEKFHVPSSLVLDSLALTGDKSDDVPGIDKVGPKTAGKWLMDFGCLEEVLANAHTLTGKVADNLKNNLDVPVLSRQLVTLKTDVPLNLTWKELRIAPRP